MSTPRIILSLHTMSPAKAAPNVLQNHERKKGLYANPSESICTGNEGTEPRVPTRNSGMREAFLTFVRSAQKAIGRKGVLGPHTRNLPNLMRVALRSRNSSETMVEASTECSTTSALPTLLTTRKLRTTRSKPLAVLMQAAKAADEAFAGS